MPRTEPRLTIIGDVGIDLLMGPVENWPAIGTEVLVERSEMRLGGSAGNTALAMWLLGAEFRLLTSTGNDFFGQWLTDQVARFDVVVTAIDAPTSITAGIMHSCGERSFFTLKGHLEHFGWDHLKSQLSESAEGSIVLLTGAFLLPNLRSAYPDLLPELRRRGYRIAMDTGWPSAGWTAATRDEVLGWLGHCDHLLLNEVEAMGLAAQDDVPAALSVLGNLLRPNGTLVVKRGHLGAVGLQSGCEASVAAPKLVPSDTIGAGDCFNAGYLHARASGRDLKAALEAGCATASQVISRFPRHAIRPGEIKPLGK